MRRTRLKVRIGSMHRFTVRYKISSCHPMDFLSRAHFININNRRMSKVNQRKIYGGSKSIMSHEIYEISRIYSVADLLKIKRSGPKGESTRALATRRREAFDEGKEWGKYARRVLRRGSGGRRTRAISSTRATVESRSRACARARDLTSRIFRQWASIIAYA